MDSACNRIGLAFGHTVCLAEAEAFSLAAFLLITLSLWVLCIVLLIRATRRRRRETARRPHMSTEDFLERIDAPPEYAGLFVAVRKAMAQQGKVPVEVIYPDDSMKSRNCSLICNG